jgi:hypothetical protein
MGLPSSLSWRPTASGVDQFALAGRQHYRAGEFALVDFLSEGLVNAVEFLSGHPDMFSRGLREPEICLRPSCRRDNENSGDERRTEYPPFHGHRLSSCDEPRITASASKSHY